MRYVLLAISCFLTSTLVGCGSGEPKTLDKDGGYVLHFEVEETEQEELTPAEIEARAVARIVGYSNVPGAEAKLIDGELHVALPGVDERQAQHCLTTLVTEAQLGLQLAADPMVDAEIYALASADDSLQVATPSGQTAIWRTAGDPKLDFGAAIVRSLDGVDHCLLLEGQEEIHGPDFANFRRTNDANLGGLAIEFEMTPGGAKRLQQLTQSNLGRPLAIVFNHQIVSMPTIRGVISDRGVITGGFSDEDIDKLLGIGMLGMYGELPKLRFLSQEKVEPK